MNTHIYSDKYFEMFAVVDEDEIVVMDSGELVQFGNHETLVADENGKYYELWNAQAQ